MSLAFGKELIMSKITLINRKIITAIAITGITITALGLGQGSFANETNQVDYVAVQDTTNQDQVQVVEIPNKDNVESKKQNTRAFFVPFILGWAAGEFILKPTANLVNEYVVNPVIDNAVKPWLDQTVKPVVDSWFKK
jgi:hypothetical protein